MGEQRSFDDYPPVMDTTQVAQMLGIPDIETVQKMAREGRLPSHRESGSRIWQFDRDQLVAWLRHHREAVRPD